MGYEMARFRTEGPTTLVLLNSCSVSELLLPGEKRKKRTNNMGYLCCCLKMQKEEKKAWSYTSDLSGRVVIIVDEDDRNESKTHLGQVCHFQKTSKQES